MSDTRASHPVDKIVVIGGKGSAVVIAEQIYDNQQTVHDVELLGYAFDDPAFYPDIHGIPIVCKTREAWDKYRDDPSVKFVFALYRPDLIKERMALRDSYGIPLERYATFVHHSAYVAQSARMGYGNIVLAHAVINPGARLGNFNTIQSGTLIGHDTTVGDTNFFAAQCAIGSNDVIGNGTFFGLHATLNNYVSVGDYAFVGMAANVVKSVPADALVYGNPAHPVAEKHIKPL